MTVAILASIFFTGSAFAQLGADGEQLTDISVPTNAAPGESVAVQVSGAVPGGGTADWYHTLVQLLDDGGNVIGSQCKKNNPGIVNASGNTSAGVIVYYRIPASPETATYRFRAIGCKNQNGGNCCTGEFGLASGSFPVSEDVNVAPILDTDIAITNSSSPSDTVAAGSGDGGANLIHTIGVTNNGRGNATNMIVSIDLTIPAGVTYLSNDCGLTGASPNFTWNVVDIPYGYDTKRCKLEYRVGPSAASGEFVTSTAVLTDSTPPDNNATPDDGVASTEIIKSVDIALDAVGAPDLVIAGQGVPGNLVHTITATNNGPSDASGVVVEITPTLPAGVTIASVDTVNGSFSEPTWTIGVIPAGETATLEIRLTVASDTAAGIEVIAAQADLTAVNETDTNDSNDSAVDPTSVVAPLIFKDSFETADP